MSVIALQTSSWILLEWVVWVSKSYLKYYFRNHSQSDCFDANEGSKIEKLYFHMLYILLYSFLEMEFIIWWMVFIVSLKYTFLKVVETCIICISILLTVNNPHIKNWGF